MTVLTPANAFPNLAFPQHGPGLAIDAVGTEKYTASGVSATYTGITVGAGANRALVVSVVWGQASTAPTGISVVWDSGGTNQSMTQIALAGPSNGPTTTGFAALYGLVAPTSGNKTLAVSWTNAGETFIAGISFTGVNQAGGATSFPNAVTNTGVITQTVTSAVGDYVVTARSGGQFGAPTGTNIYTDTVNGAVVNAGMEYDHGAAPSITSGWAPGNTNSTAIISCGVKALSVLLSQVTSFTYPGSVWPKATGPAVLSWLNAFAGIAFPQHLSGQTNTVQNFLYPGAVQPAVPPPPALFILMPQIVT